MPRRVGGTSQDDVSTTWWRIGQALLLLVTLVLLASAGGAGIYAAPLLLPLQLVAARASGSGMRAVWTLVGAATAGETAWALTYLAVAERQPWIWLIPLLVAALTGAIIAQGATRASHE